MAARNVDLTERPNLQRERGGGFALRLVTVSWEEESGWTTEIFLSKVVHAVRFQIAEKGNGGLALSTEHPAAKRREGFGQKISQ